MSRLHTLSLSLFVLVMSWGVDARGQNPLPFALPPIPPASQPTPPTAPGPSPGNSASQAAPYGAATPSPATEAARLAAWNSPQMLSARKFLTDYFARAKAISPQQASAYMTRLQQMSPDQTKAWLASFENGRLRNRQQQAGFDRGRQVGVAGALDYARQTQEAYDNMSHNATAAATMARDQINQLSQQARENAVQQNTGRDVVVSRIYQPDWFWSGPYTWIYNPMYPYYSAASSNPEAANQGPGDRQGGGEAERGAAAAAAGVGLEGARAAEAAAGAAARAAGAGGGG